MTRLHAALIALAFALPSAAAEPLAPADFAARFALGQVADGLNRLELDEAVYRVATDRALRDLRVFNGNGEALPLAVLPRAPLPEPAVRTVDLALAPLPVQDSARAAALQSYAVRFERDRERAVLEVRGTPATGASDVGGYLVDARALKDSSGRLRLEFAPDAPDYAGRVELLGSDDLVNWRAVAHGPLARELRLGAAIEKNRFELQRPPAFLRVQWSGAAAPRIAAARFDEPLPAASALPRARLVATSGGDGRSVYADVPPALPVERLFIRLPQANMSERVTVLRHVADPQPRARRLGLLPRRAPQHWIAVGTYDVFRVVRAGAEVEGEPIPFAAPTDGVRLDFGAPYAGALPTLEAEWRPARIAFAARAPGPYVLAVGRDDAPASPTLDLRSLLPADDPAGVKLPAARLEPVAAATQGDARGARIAAQAHWSRAVLWGVLALAVLGLAWMAWRLAAQLRAPAARTPPGAGR